ncbi:MAG: S-layer homology domain-containing protein [Armatimonadota bacterium]
MKKASLFAGALALAAIGIASPVLAQDGMFKDVPNDHWAYQALERLGADKVFIGDPDGTFKGKRSLTRYEMAMVVDRLIRMVDEKFVKAPLPEFPKPAAPGVSRGDVEGMLGGYAKKSDLDGKADKSALAGLAKQSDIDMIRRMAAEFQTELTTLGVDVDKVKKSLDNHEKRIAAIEDAWKKRVQVSGAYNAYARSTFAQDGTTLIDKDGYTSAVRGAADTAQILNDFDLNIKATPSENASIDVSLNFGNYLGYLGSVADLGSGNRGGGQNGLPFQTSVYKAVASFGASLPIVGSTAVSVGRIPVKLTKYTFHGVTVDSYFTNVKSNGLIPVDGATASFKVGPFSVSTLAARHDNNLLTTGLVNGGATFARAAGATAGFDALGFNLGVTYVSYGLDSDTRGTASDPGTLTVQSITASRQLFGLPFSGEFAQNDRSTNGVDQNLSDNTAYEVGTKIGSGSWTLSGGYRQVEQNFSAPGNWDRLGTFQNPTNIKGAYGTFNLNLGSRLAASVTGRDYKPVTGAGANLANVSTTLNYRLSPVSEFSASVDKTDNGSAVTQKFTSFNFSKQLSGNSLFRLGYQIADHALSAVDSKGGIVTSSYSVRF